MTTSDIPSPEPDTRAGIPGCSSKSWPMPKRNRERDCEKRVRIGNMENREGSETVEFDCVGCGRHIIAFGLRAVPSSGLCGCCQIAGPARNRLMQDYSDGTISWAEFERRFAAVTEPIPGVPANDREGA